MFNFNCHSTSVSVVNTRLASAHSHSLDSWERLTSLPSVDIMLSLHIYITLLTIAAELVTQSPYWLQCCEAFRVVTSHVQRREGGIISLVVNPTADPKSIFHYLLFIQFPDGFTWKNSACFFFCFRFFHKNTGNAQFHFNFSYDLVSDYTHNAHQLSSACF